ncbi:uncharacterized protein LOC62_05G007562 [Vanrija pseudolonga]|uniref:Uncharacterized protein n=1 Tax=Vanrija pseudolonga TaxID=143232 RepID=A0AAF0YC86_9TREE|nr:hypothetical protein LOC62_05G007562 [Vanrija pseudolonga]
MDRIVDPRRFSWLGPSWDAFSDQISSMETAHDVHLALMRGVAEVEPAYVLAVLRSYVEFKLSRERTPAKVGTKMAHLEKDLVVKEQKTYLAQSFAVIRAEYSLPLSPIPAISSLQAGERRTRVRSMALDAWAGPYVVPTQAFPTDDTDEEVIGMDVPTGELARAIRHLSTLSLHTATWVPPSYAQATDAIATENQSRTLEGRIEELERLLTIEARRRGELEQQVREVKEGKGRAEERVRELERLLVDMVSRAAGTPGAPTVPTPRPVSLLTIGSVPMDIGSIGTVPLAAPAPVTVPVRKASLKANIMRPAAASTVSLAADVPPPIPQRHPGRISHTKRERRTSRIHLPPMPRVKPLSWIEGLSSGSNRSSAQAVSGHA